MVPVGPVPEKPWVGQENGVSHGLPQSSAR
jgi:hypothetical protein